MNNRLPLALLFLRLSVFLVMFMWTLDKFVRPEHASTVYEHFYFIAGVSNVVLFTIGAIELLIIFGFLIGFQKKINLRVSTAPPCSFNFLMFQTIFKSIYRS